MKLIPRFIAQNVVEKLEQGKELTIGEDHFKRGETGWLKTNGQEQDFDKTLSKIVEGVAHFTLDGVQYFKRNNVGGKTRWYKLEDREPKQPQGAICNAQDIESNAHQLFLQALLIQMDNKLHLFFEDFLDQAILVEAQVIVFT